MLLLVVLLVQVMPLSPITVWDVIRLTELWEEQNSACLKLPDSDEGQAACYRRDALGLQLGRLGWCVRHMGLGVKWEMCPPTGT